MMGKIVQTATGNYIRCEPNSGIISNEQNVLELLACCYEAESNQIMIYEEQLHPDFFDLKTGLAGSIFQKLSNYSIKAAIIISTENIQSQRFQELIFEANKGNHINFFSDVVEAEKWLTT